MSKDAKELRATLEAIVGEDNLQEEGPHWHVQPGSASEVAELVRLAAERGATVLPVGKGGRYMPTDDLRVQLLLNMRRMDHVLHLDEDSLTVHVQAGLSGVELEEILAKRGLTIGDFPPAALGPTVGGLLSVRTPGKSSRRHGTFEDTVLGVSAVLADGRSVHTRVAPRRATGPDLARALCGSEGTLGIITSAVLRVHRRPETRLLAAYCLPSISDALMAVRLALREEASPAAMRIYDPAEAKVHLEGVWEADAERECSAILVAATVGPTSLAACDRDLISSAVEVAQGEMIDEAIAAQWWKRRTGRLKSDVVIPAPNLQVSATPTKLAPVYDRVAELSAEHGLELRAHASRFDFDGGVFFFTICDAEGTPLSPTDERLSPIAEAADQAGAYLLGKTNASLRSYFDELRDSLDPKRHLNPGVLR